MRGDGGATGGRRLNVCRRSGWLVGSLAAALLAGWWVQGAAGSVGGESGRSGSAGAGSSGLVVFSVATAVQFVNNADDEVRGAANNPFAAASAKLEPKLSLKGEGPFAGDVTVYSFDLYGDAALRRKVGSASLTCYYNYRAHALCLAYYELAAGTVVASGPVDFTKTGFTLVVTGGTHRYLGAVGELDAMASGRGSQRLAFRFVPAAVGGRSRLSVVEVPMTAQFMNHADDRIRGMTNNPFDVQSRGLVIVTKGKEKANGPFPGDDVLYTFDLKDAVGGGRVGSAIFTCYFLFLKRATCDAYLDLPGGTLLASGTVAFDASRFTLDVSGGTGRYLARGGAITGQAAGASERLNLILT